MAILESDLARDLEHNNANGSISSVRVPLNRARHVTSQIYYSQEIFDLEKEKIFMKDWLCVARNEEVERPGDYMTLRIMGEPVLLVRDNGGKLRAFRNMCAHRGVEVINGAGCTKEFSCPYHGWRYDLAGRLTGAPLMNENELFDSEKSSLPEIKLGTWAGWIFINFDPTCGPLAERISDFANDLAFLKMEDCRLASKIRIELDCNWKLVVENLLDVYHVAVLHGGSFGKYRGPAEKQTIHMRKQGGTFTTYTSAPMLPGGQTLFRNMPAIADRGPNFAVSSHLAPNLQVITRSDNCHPQIMWPATPTTSYFDVYIMFPNEFFAERDLEQRVKLYHDYMIYALEEDRSMICSLQRAMESRYYTPGPMAKLEISIHHLLNDYLDRLFGPDFPNR
ncbi:MAG: aromatic ring-hydroxylating dioxygenase subunit alpha [Alphaproteobacteria bacterium]|nr:aromatic ring-hydroxylating dioxygenase subunit alpha [Alphaproteobacteria bacterium]